MRRRLNTMLLVSLTVCPLFMGACQRSAPGKSGARAGQPASSGGPSPAAASRPTSLSEKPLAPCQGELLDLAFRTATAIPVNPHKFDRAKTQAAVVTTCLELDQPRRALEYIQQIGDWRRGDAYAALALYCAQHGQTELAATYAARAEEIAKKEEDWRRDTIRVKIAQMHAVLGQGDKATAIEATFEPAETHIVSGVRARQADKAAFDEELKALDACIAAKKFDPMRNALESATRWFDSFYADVERRRQVEKRIKDGPRNFPMFIRIDLLLELARIAVSHADAGKGLELVNEAQGLFDGANWPLKTRIEVVARLARARFAAGDAARAKADAEAALKLFEAQRNKLLDIDRAQILLPLGEAYQAMGEAKAALGVYSLAVENGVVNPNSRPRAEDLSATCRSMAKHAVEPDAALWARIREVHKGLGNPW
ncbi:MAG: hypothetical protein NT031_11455 [Planctomycetota bacterium]|nr:hypothetical protein [Planctomycetota bacterium]